MKRLIVKLLCFGALLSSCTVNIDNTKESMAGVDKKWVDAACDSIVSKGAPDSLIVAKGVSQVAEQWRAQDGSGEDFVKFCVGNFAYTPDAKRELLIKLSKGFEAIWGNYNEMSLALKRALHIDDGSSLSEVDYIFGAYEASAHMNEDLYNNKIAFITILNFPFYTLEEKDSLGEGWSRLEWGYARMGDIFTPKAPAAVNQMVADAEMRAESYIAGYNIFMGSIVTKDGERLFPQDMRLLSHWNLRDEIKSNYAKGDKNLIKQRLIYNIMLRIVDQTIPVSMIDNGEFAWDPEQNLLYKDGSKVEDFEQEDAGRYKVLLDQFKAQRELDRYSKAYPTAIKRAFDGQMQLPVEEVEAMFKELLSSPKVAKVAQMIKERLGRDLEPFDIWYDGFKSRSSVSQDELDKLTKRLYPNAAAFDAKIPEMLMKLGFSKERAAWLGDAIVVEPARGSGHAWGAQSTHDLAHLRTRLSPGGMDYKGFNIAVHELGHNVEQTISMRDVDYYILNGVPNTAFTEALAFVFQKRDMQLLGYGSSAKGDDMTGYDIFWGSYEIMGVALTDIEAWRWMYSNPDATPQELKQAVIDIAGDIWDRYYKPILGGDRVPLLAIYSHMLNSPLYLANYPFGHIVEYQLESYLKDKKLSDEVLRIFALGNLTPQQWMLNAVGQKVSVKSMLN